MSVNNVVDDARWTCDELSLDVDGIGFTRTPAYLRKPPIDPLVWEGLIIRRR